MCPYHRGIDVKMSMHRGDATMVADIITLCVVVISSTLSIVMMNDMLFVSTGSTYYINSKYNSDSVFFH